MAIVGSADLWADFFPDNLIPDILNMVVDVWSNFTKPTLDEHEVPITKRFRASLEQYKDLKMLPVRIDREVPVDDLAKAEEIGRIDLRLTHGYRSNVYFAFECKRLNIVSKNGKTSSLANEYVVSGMARFVGSNPQYARTLTQGGMIGYVMNGKTENAIKAVDKQVKKHYIDLQMTSASGLGSSSRSLKKLVKESLHNLPHQEFTLHHVFLPI
ncbi:hypothetical protein BST81_18440 [Leptolyngbya sp. 'hensonii']|uniref:hypothetical protein n=1 Tax=Leptolyngbya sp. 'hensonii' TaxID=1922337 RepID=UPI00094FC826|nr:hypothetical protein [Leptolyngbya sp. 'hensonii']OLP16963.1 hypothetical protein BST81_18440 [Leptolyngbya sp. 'hensonii']